MIVNKMRRFAPLRMTNSQEIIPTSLLFTRSLRETIPIKICASKKREPFFCEDLRDSNLHLCMMMTHGLML